MAIGKPTRAGGYDARRTALVRSACLEVATRLDDLRSDICIVGGLVPTLLIDVDSLPGGSEAHLGTNDLDLALSITVLSERRYEEIARRLRAAGFEQDRNERGRRTSQRWRRGPSVLVDFLIQPLEPGDRGGTLRNLERDFAAVVTPGLHLAFRDRDLVEIDGEALAGGTARRSIHVCGPGAFAVLKALAFRGRGEPKDAYDLWYVIQHRSDVARRLQWIAGDAHAREALKILKEDFIDAGRIGPRRVAEFLVGGADEDLQADVAGRVRSLLSDLGT